MLLTGSFREYPFLLLLEIFLRREETGLLEVSSPEESGYFYIKNGKVKDGQIGTSRGAAAVKLVGRCVDGSFRFKPLEPTDYARVVWQRSFGPNPLATDATSFSVAPVRSKFGHLRSYPAAAHRFPGRTLAFSAHGVLRTLLLFPLATYRSLEKTALFVQQHLVSWTIAGFGFWKRAHPGTKLLTIFARKGNEVATIHSYRPAVYQASTQALLTSTNRVSRQWRLNMAASRQALLTSTNRVSRQWRLNMAASRQALLSSTNRFSRQWRLNMATTYQGLSHTTELMMQRTAAGTTAAFKFWQRAEVGTRLLRVAKNGFTAWQSALRRDKLRILIYARGFEISLPKLPTSAVIVYSLKQGIRSNVAFILAVCVMGAVSALCMYQLLATDENAKDSRITIDENFETQASPAGRPASTKRKTTPVKRRSTERKSNGS